jgi:hypothetical protein
LAFITWQVGIQASVVPGRCVFWDNVKFQTLSAVPGDSSYPNRRLSNIIRINFSGELFRPLFAGRFRRRMLKGDGTPIHSEWKGKFDGKDYAITGDPDANKRSYKKMNDRTLFMTAKKGAEVIAQGLVVVSADGKSQDVTLTSPDAVMSVYNEKAKAKATEKGKEKGFRNKAVFDKE